MIERYPGIELASPGQVSAAHPESRNRHPLDVEAGLTDRVKRGEQGMTVAEWIRRCARRRPDSVAYVDGERRLTFSQFNERVNRQANGLYAEGVQRGDRVATHTNKTTSSAWRPSAAAAKGGFVHVPVNFRSVPQMAYVLNHCGASLLLVEKEYAEKVREAGHLSSLRKIIEIDPGNTDSEYERWLASNPTEPTVDVTGEDNFFICYTGGATGTPKGVLHQQKQSVAHAPVVVIGYEFTRETKVLLVYPHNSIASINMFYVPSWLLGACVVFTDQRNFNADRWLELVEKERVPIRIWCPRCSSACSKAHGCSTPTPAAS
jgi:acyl-coenzyme A synthetase/AMP-(fatty) acid ligase